MSTTMTEPINEGKLHEFVMRAVGEMGAAMNAALILVGDKLGLYKGMAGAGPMTPAELAAKTGTHERYVREWLAAQAAGGFVTYDAAAGRYTLPPEQAFAMADENSPVFLPGFFEIIEACVKDVPKITMRFVQAREWAGTSTMHVCLPARSASSVPTTALILSTTGFRRSVIQKQNSKPEQRWQT